MRLTTVIALSLGLLLIAAPILRSAAQDDDEYDDGDDEDAGEGKDVVSLTSNNFEKILKKSKFALVAFTAPWCGHCKTLKPHYEKAATALKALDPTIIIGMVDATEEKELSKKFGVSGYPSLKWFIDGELAIDYNGGRDEEGLVSWVRKKTGPVAYTVTDLEKLTKLEEDNVVLVVGYFKAFEGAAFEDFIGVAVKVEDLTFVQTTDATIAAAAGLAKKGSISLIKNFKGTAREVALYDGDSVSALQAWVKAEKMPLSIEFSPANSDKIFNSGIPLQLILWASAAELAPGAALITAFQATAAKFKGQLVFVTVNNEGADHEPVTGFFGFTGKVSPQVSGFLMEKNKKFKFDGEVTADQLEAFATALVNGDAGADFKSEEIPLPPADKDGEVQIVVGKSLTAIAMDPTKDVLLEVYAPWCGFCKKLDPIYKELAERFKSVDSIIIAKMDGTDNEHPDVEVKGYPTMIFYPSGKDAAPLVLPADVPRTLEGFTQFLKMNAKIAYELAPSAAVNADEDEESSPASAGDGAKDEL